ncbi:MAG: RHS repeat-associated core domain-containing protein [Phycisphaeraceae bacterium]|nr:RHS repeat-associated core domain-containing protein [Phycisphaeraceae bacterium]
MEIVGRTSSEYVQAVSINNAAAWHQHRMFHKRLTFNNFSDPVVGTVNVLEVPGLSSSSKVFLPEDPEEFWYDADGNLTRDGVWHYAWDAENRLKTMQMRDEVAQVLLSGSNPWTRIEFRYDWLGRRISKMIQTTNDDPAVYGTKTGPPITWSIDRCVRYVWDGWHLSLSYRTTSNGAYLGPDQSFAWGPDLSSSYGGAGGIGGLVAYCDDDYDANNHPDPDLGPMYPIYDGNGNVVRMCRFVAVSSGGFSGVECRTAAAYEYGPFGEALSVTGEDLGPSGGGGQGQRNPFRFSTKYTDAETGLVYYGYRYYSHGMGRWVSRDPIGEADGPNVFAYVGNDPVGAVDPLGLWRWLGGRRQGQVRARMLPDEGDDVWSAAAFVGLQPQQSAKWLYNETNQSWVHQAQSIDPCSTYSVPNTYYITTGNLMNPMGWKNLWGWHTGLNSLWWLTSLHEQVMSRTSDFVSSREHQGFHVVRLTNVTKRELERLVGKRDITALYFAGHGANGILWTGEQHRRPDGSVTKIGVEPGDLIPRQHHFLSELVLYVCEADQYQLKPNRHEIITWRSLVSSNGYLRASTLKVRPLFTAPDEMPAQPGGPR